MSWPADGKPRFQVTKLSYRKSVDVYVVDRGNCYRVVRSFPASVEIGGIEVPAGCRVLPKREADAGALAAELNEWATRAPEPQARSAA